MLAPVAMRRAGDLRLMGDVYVEKEGGKGFRESEKAKDNGKR